MHPLWPSHPHGSLVCKPWGGPRSVCIDEAPHRQERLLGCQISNHSLSGTLQVWSLLSLVRTCLGTHQAMQAGTVVRSILRAPRFRYAAIIVSGLWRIGNISESRACRLHPAQSSSPRQILVLSGFRSVPTKVSHNDNSRIVQRASHKRSCAYWGVQAYTVVDATTQKPF